MILLTLILGGSLTQHWITQESYIPTTYTYVEGGVQHTVTDAYCVNLSGTTARIATNRIFTGGFNGS